MEGKCGSLGSVMLSYRVMPEIKPWWGMETSVSVIRILLYFTGLALLSIPSLVVRRERNRNL